MAGNLDDCELLRRFVTRRDGDAFALLVERHGPMVLRVCRDVVGDGHDAHDAFQATFLVLIRRARSIRKHQSLGSWLHGVARRVAGKIRTASVRRQFVEGRASLGRARELDEGRDAQRLIEGLELHEAIGRLPETYRAPIVLCYLEGLSHTQAAARLGWPVGTVRGRLARARDRLRRRLEGCGLANPALVTNVPPAEVPAHLARSVVNLALTGAKLAADRGVMPAGLAELAEGAVRPMWIGKTTVTAIVVTVGGALASGTAWLARDERAGQRGSTMPAKVAREGAPAGPTDVLAANSNAAAANGSGIALLDYDGDGRLDLYVAHHDRFFSDLQDCRLCHTQTPMWDQWSKSLPKSPPAFSDWLFPGGGVRAQSSLEKAYAAYRVDAGDALRLRLSLADRRPEVAEHVVSPQGEIDKVWSRGVTVKVSGLTAREIKRRIIQALRQDASDLELQLVKVEEGRPVAVNPDECPAVDVEIIGYNSNVFRVEGAVGHPGTFPVTGNETMLDALNYAGAADALQLRAGVNVTLYRKSEGGGIARRVDVERIRAGDPESNLTIQAGDKIVVSLPNQPPATHEARVQAPVDAGIDQRLRAQEDRLKTLETKLDRVLEAIERQGPSLAR